MGVVGEATINFDSAIKNSVEKIVMDTVAFIPKLLVAILIFVAGWVIASVFSWIVEKLLFYLGLEKFMKRHKLDDSLGSVKMSAVLVKLSKYYIMLIFLQASISMLNLGTITEFITSVLLYAPVFIGALLVVVAAAVLGELLKEKIVEIQSKSRTLKWLADATKALVVFLGMMVGLSTMGFQIAILVNSFIAILQGIVYGIALAFGLAFGLGGQDDAKDLIKKVRKKTGV
jgi:hypothetical protein